MLTYIAVLITGFLVLEIARSSRSSDATGYLLVSGLIPLPLHIIGKSAEASFYPMDACLLGYVVVHGGSLIQYVRERRTLSAGVVALVGLSALATFSGIFNFLYVDPSALKFYAYTVARFWEYVLLAIALGGHAPNPAQLRRISVILLIGILAYEILHTLHVGSIVPLSGEAYFGPRAAEYDAGEVRAAPFSDNTAWFLTSYRGVIGGTASIGAWVSLMMFEAYRGRVKALAGMAAVFSVLSVLAVSSRSDTVGLVVASVVYALCAPLGKLKVYVCAAAAVAGIYLAFVTFALPSTERATALTRMSELWDPDLRAEGDYADRSSDRASMLKYLPEHPRELLIGVGPGNFHWYEAQRITYNFFGHNSYLHWTGELGFGGLILVLAWCISVSAYAIRGLRHRCPMPRLAARTCLAIVTGRMVTAWGSECLFGTQGMGCYSLYFVGTVYLLISIVSVGETTDSTPLSSTLLATACHKRRHYAHF